MSFGWFPNNCCFSGVDSPASIRELRNSSNAAGTNSFSSTLSNSQNNFLYEAKANAAAAIMAVAFSFTKNKTINPQSVR
jgi:hypothetical protein